MSVRQPGSVGEAVAAILAAESRVVGAKPPGAGPVTVSIDGLRVESEANAHAHWRTRQKRARAQRAIVRGAMLGIDAAALRASPRLRVTFVRVKGPRGRDMDSDNLAGAFKAIRDEVAAVVGRDDGEAWWDWRYDPVQVRGSEYGVRIRFEPLPAGEG